MTEQITGIKTAQDMREAGFPQEGESFWWEGEHGMTFLGKTPAATIGKVIDDKGWAAYTVKQMEKWLPKEHKDPRLEEKTNKANNFAMVLIDLKKEGKINV